jgi:hypothetical protein
MAPFSRLGWFSSVVVFTSVVAFTSSVATVAKASSPDPRTLRDQLEEDLIEGDRDAEDIAVLHLPASSIGTGRRAGPAYLTLAAFAGDRSGGREWGGFAVLQIPFERVAQAPRMSGSSERATTLPIESNDPGWSPQLLGTGIVEGAQKGQLEKPSAGPIVVTPDVARGCVRAAWRVLGIADDASIDAMATRARTSSALPELRLRAMRTMDASGRATSSDADPYRYTEAGGATNWFEARLTFRLDRLIFADEEVSLERVRVDRSEVRAKTAAKVLQALFEWQRAYALVQEPATSTAEHFAASLRELEASAILDVMTDGWFGHFRGSLAARGP